jgi:hypothetical protein
MKIKDIINKTLLEIFSDNNCKSIHGEYGIRFELGGDMENGTKERVDQAVSRAIEIFKQTIGNDDILIIIEEYLNDFFDKDGTNKDYLYSLINKTKLKKYKGPFEQICFEIDENGIKREFVFEDKLECDLLIGRMTREEIDPEGIIRGKANLEMGFEPSIPQDITFFSPFTTNGFRMYDDRGCDIWSKHKEKLRLIYISLNDWILDDNRSDYDKVFK